MNNITFSRYRQAFGVGKSNSFHFSTSHCYKQSLFHYLQSSCPINCQGCRVTYSISSFYLICSLASAWVWTELLPVDSTMLSHHLFLWHPLFLPPCTVSCRMDLESAHDLDTWVYHFSLLFFMRVTMFL